MENVGNMQNIERKLAAIMFTDIYGYSRLMSINEDKALKMLSEHDQLLETIISSFHGNVLKKMGDAFLVEFSSSVEAVNCAITIQNNLKIYNSEKLPEDRIIIRIGLHVGDVIVRDNDLFGEGINVAARLEPLADPGGICLSQSIFESIQSDAEHNLIKIGEVELKNILKKYVVYKIPSIYGDEFANRNKKELKENNQNSKYSYTLKKIINLPVKYLSPSEITAFTLLFFVFCIFLMSYITQGALDIKMLISFIAEEKMNLFILFALLLLVTIYFYSTKSVRIILTDIREIDNVLEFLVTQIGYNRPKREGNFLIFKPSVYQVVMYTFRSIKCYIDGNSVVITGNFMAIVKLLKMIKSYGNAKSVR